MQRNSNVPTVVDGSNGVKRKWLRGETYQHKDHLQRLINSSFDVRRMYAQQKEREKRKKKISE